MFYVYIDYVPVIRKEFLAIESITDTASGRYWILYSGLTIHTINKAFHKALTHTTSKPLSDNAKLLTTVNNVNEFIEQYAELFI